MDIGGGVGAGLGDWAGGMVGLGCVMIRCGGHVSGGNDDGSTGGADNAGGTGGADGAGGVD